LSAPTELLQSDCSCAILKGQCASPASADRGALLSLSSQLTPFAFVERLLEAEDPIWYRWDQEVPTLIDEVTRAAHREFAKTPGETVLERHSERHRRRCLIWLLDRLVPMADSAHFKPFLASDSGLFAWGHRLRPEERHLLIEAAAGSASARWYESTVLAWCASCPEEEVTSLLDWVEPWEPVFRAKGVSPLLPIPEREFFLRCKDKALRRSLMCAHLATAAQRFREGRDFDRSVVRGSIHVLLRLLLLDAGAPCPTEPTPDSAENWKAWLDQILTTAVFADVKAAAGEFLSWYGGHTDTELAARRLWISCHGPDDWRSLHQLALQNSDCFIYARLAEIMPSDRLEEWDWLVLQEPEDHGQMRAFCRWLLPENADVLRSHFDHSDADWGACAYHAYLAKAPEAVLQHQWRRRDRLPGWQVRLLDRRLFAPPAVRPGPVVEDIQDAEWDFRLEDPLSRRGI